MTYRTTKRQNWPRVPRKSLELTQYEGFTLLNLVALEVTEPLVVTCCGERLTIMDVGYRWLTLCEPGARHVTTVHCDAAGDPVQIYVDIITFWEFGADGFPCYRDMYLDVIALLDGRAEIIDGEELEEAFAGGVVSREQYDVAWMEARAVHDAIRSGTFAPVQGAFRALEAQNP
jgi:predicted RNA-binding protein associated with RNAse of E/G family